VRRQQTTFLLTGLIAGLICVTLGRSWLGILGLGVGALFFVAVLAGIAITGAWRYMQVGYLRYLAGLVLSTISYEGALVAFFGVTGFSPDWFGFRPSADIVDFRIDVWLGLIAAGAVGASGIALFTAFLTGKWSNSLLLRLMLAGFLTMLVTFTANLPFHNYWSFLGVLLPLGNALFCWLVGAQIWRDLGAASQIAATAPTA
jgi:hypothetical protein